MKHIIDTICREYAEQHDFSGVCLYKEQGETVFAGAYGYANRAYEIPNRIDTRFDTASVTKTFTAAAVMQLVDARKMRLEDKITALVDLSGTKIPEDVTIHHLLSHTSGIADDADEEAGENYADLFRDSPNYAIRECRDFLKNFAYKEPNFKAGTARRYCNCSFVLLGLAMEAVTGKSYREYVRENIFAKAGMTGSDFLSMDGINPNTAEGYILEDDGTWRKNIYSYPPQGTPDGGAYTTAEDMNRFLAAIRGNVLMGEDVSKALLSPQVPFTKPQTRDQIPGLYLQGGYAFEFLMLPERKTPVCICKDGINDGVSAKFSWYPEKNITLTFLANQNCNVWEMTRKIQREIYQRYYC